jgi:hypothetical protein
VREKCRAALGNAIYRTLILCVKLDFISKLDNEVKEMMKKVLLAIVLAAMVMPVFAKGWSDKGVITDLRIYNDSGIYGRLEVSALECGGRQFKFESSSFAKETYSMLLSAKISGTPVNLFQSGSCDNNGRTIINGARLQD